ncbi:MAG: winged helix-turn-helix domain-containing protein [Prolixibacteraceae bacterium]|jgi:restriction system protein|nr:winged helix-turn-helix domain-containing protein [Prolixibacteraceae bacterium]
MDSLPKREFFFKYVLKALDELGGSGSIGEINSKVAKDLDISKKLLSEQYKNTTQTEFEYQMAWVRTMLKNQGLIENSSRGIWVLKAKSNELDSFKLDEKDEKRIDKEIEAEEIWKSTAMSMVTNHISPNATYSKREGIRAS